MVTRKRPLSPSQGPRALDQLCAMDMKSVAKNVCSWGEVPLPDSLDGSLQGGDHVFNEEVIPIAPVFCHGIACPSICEGDIYVNFISHK